MRLIFREYFRPTKEELTALWGDSLLAFDTSVLLNVYGYSSAKRFQISFSNTKTASSSPISLPLNIPSVARQ
jgi:hypothetical protein